MSPTTPPALVAADRGERRMWARHRALLTMRVAPIAPAPVIAQAWRGGGRQAHLARLLRGCEVHDLDDHQARAVGDLVVSSDLHDLTTLAAAVSRHLEVERP